MRKKEMNDLDTIFRAGLRRVDPYRMILEHVRPDGSCLKIGVENDLVEIDLADFREVYILGAGKATAPMARALEEILGARLTAGLIVVKYGHTDRLQTVEVIAAGHPVPDQNGVLGAQKLMALAEKAGNKSLVFNLLSGGGSALLPYPGYFKKNGKVIQLTLADKQETTQALLASGAEIGEINCVRKHLSAIKGGRFLARIAPARSVSFLLSDVVGDDVSSIASGLTAADPTTFIDAVAVLQRYKIESTVPQRVRHYLQAGMAGDVPESLKEGDAALELNTNILLGTNRTAMNAAARQAEMSGYTVVRLTSRITGEAREVAKVLASIAADARHGLFSSTTGPLCIISGGEPVVTISGKGKGGRNQELALAFLREMERQPELYGDVTFLAASTDGNDGPTDAAGAFASLDLVMRCKKNHLDIAEFLGNNDSYHLFQAIDGLYRTGPTNTNVCDLHIVLIN